MGNKFLLIGASGELGTQILKLLKPTEVYTTYYTRNTNFKSSSCHLDVTDRASVERLVRELKPATVIDASISDRSIKGLDRSKARRAIVEGAINVAESSAGIGARSVHISTDLVFDGMAGNYLENSPTNPLSFYGKFKAEMESVLLGLQYNLAIVRTSLIITFDPMGHQVSWIVNSIQNNNVLKLYTDEFRSPILGNDLARAVLELSGTDFNGLINIGGPESINRYSLGLKIADYMGLDSRLIKPVLARESKQIRPLYCTLDSSAAYSLLKSKINKISEIA